MSFPLHVRQELIDGNYIMPDRLYFTKGFSFKPMLFSANYNNASESNRWHLSLDTDWTGCFYKITLERDGVDVPLTKDERKFLLSVYWSSYDHCKDYYQREREKSRKWP